MTAQAGSQLADALAKVQAKLPEIRKSETAEVKNDKGQKLYSYSYASLDAVSAAILPLLAENGLSWLCKPTLNSDGKFVLAYKLLHVSGEVEEGQYPLGAGTPQQIGGAITYARRYALCAVTGVVPEHDDDGVAASRSRPQPTAPNEPGPEWEAPTDPAQQPTWYRRLITGLAQERGWDLGEIANGYAADFKEPIGQGKVENLQRYLAFLRQQAAEEDRP